MKSTQDYSNTPTPLWVAEAIVARYFSCLDSSDGVLEMTCGRGPFLQAIPAHVPAVGIEENPVLAQEAAMRSGRRVYVGDFRKIEIDFRPTAVIGNPPFRTSLIDALLDRAYALLPENGRVGMIMPVHAFQTASRVVGYCDRWSIMQELIPRNIFPGKQQPIAFALFSKNKRRTLVGFAFYHETNAITSIETRFRELLTVGRPHRSAWRAVVEAALEALGGEASLDDIYRVVEGARPSAMRWWRPTVRKIVQEHCVRTRRARYALSKMTAA